MRTLSCTTVEERPLTAAFITQFRLAPLPLCFFLPLIALVCGRGIFRLATSSPRFLMIRG